MNKIQLKLFVTAVWIQTRTVIIGIPMIIIGCIMAYLMASGNQVACLVGASIALIAVVVLSLFVVGYVIKDIYKWLKYQWKMAGIKAKNG